MSRLCLLSALLAFVACAAAQAAKAPPSRVARLARPERQAVSPTSQPSAHPTPQPAVQPNPLPKPASQPAAKPTSQPVPKASPAPRHIQLFGTTIDGEGTLLPGDYAGKLVLVHVWATWCPSCKRELPFWKDAYAKYHDQGVAFLGLPTDQNRNRTEDLVRQFLLREAITWPQIYADAPRLSDAFGVETLPWPMLVDGDTGEVLAEGDALRKQNLARRIDQFLVHKQRQSAESAAVPATSQPAAAEHP